MLISELGTELGLACVQAVFPDRPLAGAYTSDLLSDVMANAGSGAALVTIQAHRNTIAVASLTGIAAVVVCNGREPPGDMLEAAREEGIAVFSTGQSQFEVSGRLWDALRRDGA
ncbi:MAG TPA: hypothetical protein VFL04_08475 [Rectinemataceae bacterium]|nr:hypothetical protein [Rectinemataceae bacterium]